MGALSRAEQVHIGSFRACSPRHLPAIKRPEPVQSRRASTTRTSSDRWPGWQPVIGLELHVQLKGNVKLLSPAKALYDDAPNTSIAAFDAALPGSLPRIGAEPVRLAVLACLALKTEVNQASTFDRKHYFYPDLPAGFQVTQKYSPLAKDGIVNVKNPVLVAGEEQETFAVRIEQIQLEQDTAKSSHDPETGMTLVDLNRAGAALIEIVTKPDMRSPAEAAAFVRHLQAILRHVGVSDANMDRGELRCDVNVSVQRTSEDSLRGTRCEIKNLNGVRFLATAIESEIERQINELENGGTIEQATRGFNAVTGQTFHLRGKEDAPDYRYMPDPELGAVVVTHNQLEQLRDGLPELPDEAFARLKRQYGLASREAGILVALGERMDDEPHGEELESLAGLGMRFFEEVAQGREAQTAANWVIHELLGALSKSNMTLASSPVNPQDLGTLIDAVTQGRLTGTFGKALLKDFIAKPNPLRTLPQLVTESINASPSTDSLDDVCAQVINDLPAEANKVRKGQIKVLMRLVGEVMRRTNGRADAQKARAKLLSMLDTEARS
ncbi:hypothetical protein OIO90_006162 [Microbotryomycetes sp. JL221]|nr:hypothetical protein OIO90_006162 [Microbotryomycetes sp. JL221]